MPKKIYTSIVLVALCGCTHTHRVFLNSATELTSLEKINRKTQKRTITIVLLDDRSFRAEEMRISPDSTCWRAPDSTASLAVFTAEINEISFKSRGRGAVDGLIIGGLTGFPLGAMLASRNPKNEIDDRISALYARGAGGIAGVLYGAAIGAAIGSRTKFLFISPRATQKRGNEP